mmetsp:Transcript_40856/g.115568  ORF Transcript_40856/g.115568 Transcript_40856/m.115568 type:complete len:176 (-) Transcript_40856:1598-2125(-)
MDSSLLKESLSQTLQWCPLLPGRVRYTNSAAKDRAGGVTMSDKPSDHGSIYLDNSGVRFTEILWPDGATIGEHVPAVDISSLVGHGKEGPQGLLCDIPHPLDQMSGIEPVMTVKVNKFSDGWALGVSLSHGALAASPATPWPNGPACGALIPTQQNAENADLRGWDKLLGFGFQI